MKHDQKYPHHVDAFTEVFRHLADPDPGTTAANLVPILGNHVSMTLLNVLGTFLSDWYHESVAPDRESYVVLRGLRIPIESFSDLARLVSETPPGVLDKLAEGLAAFPAGTSFPKSQWPDRTDAAQYGDDVDSDPFSVAKDKLYRQVTGSSPVSRGRSGAFLPLFSGEGR